jgi:hypothetical protein
MRPVLRKIFELVLVTVVWHNSWAREGMSIDKQECIANPTVCTDMHCTLLTAPDDPFMTYHSFDCTLTRSCSSVFVSFFVKFEKIYGNYLLTSHQVRVRNYVKLKSTYSQSFDVKLDVCALMAGAKHPMVQTFLGTSIYETLQKHSVLCPWGPGLFEDTNFTINGHNRGFFGQKRFGRYRLELDFTCGQNLQFVTMKFYGKRNLTIAD